MSTPSITGEVQLDERIGQLQHDIQELTEKLTPGVPQDEFNAAKAAIDENKRDLAVLMEQKVAEEQAKDIESLKSDIEAMKAWRLPSKLGHIQQGSEGVAGTLAEGEFGKALKGMVEFAKTGDPEAYAAKAVLGTSAATGQAIIPNNIVGQVVQIAASYNPWRQLLNVVEGVRGKAVDIPYEANPVTRALNQGGSVNTYGSNKEVRDFTLATVTQAFHTIAQIVDIGNQFLRQSEGAAERLVRSRLGRSFGLAEAWYVVQGPGSTVSKGFITSFTGGAASASFTRAHSGTRGTTVAQALGDLEGRGYYATGIAMHPDDFWQAVTDTASGSGNYMMNPQAGGQWNVAADANNLPTGVPLWGVPAYRDPNLPTGTALLGDFKGCDFFVGDEYRIDVSSEAGSRWDQNITGFRGEEDIAFNADPYVITGMIQRITGL